jgi:hypothetical protein
MEGQFNILLCFLDRFIYKVQLPKLYIKRMVIMNIGCADEFITDIPTGWAVRNLLN